MTIEVCPPEASSPSARLAKSREQLRLLLAPATDALEGPAQRSGNGSFPRSVTMKMLMKAGWKGGGVLLAAALIAAKPALAARMLRYLPVGEIAKMLVARYLNK